MIIKKLLSMALLISVSMSSFGIQHILSGPSIYETRRIDYQCKSDCTNKGYSYGYCDMACSY